RVSAQQAAITHADERCTWGAVAVNLAARELLHGNRYFVEEVLHRLQVAAPRPLLEAIRRVPWEQESALPIAVRSEYGYVVHCVEDRKSTRLNSSHVAISYAVFCLKKKIT